MVQGLGIKDEGIDVWVWGLEGLWVSGGIFFNSRSRSNEHSGKGIVKGLDSREFQESWDPGTLCRHPSQQTYGKPSRRFGFRTFLKDDTNPKQVQGLGFRVQGLGFICHIGVHSTRVV